MFLLETFKARDKGLETDLLSGKSSAQVYYQIT